MSATKNMIENQAASLGMTFDEYFDYLRNVEDSSKEDNSDYEELYNQEDSEISD